MGRLLNGGGGGGGGGTSCVAEGSIFCQQIHFHGQLHKSRDCDEGGVMREFEW